MFVIAGATGNTGAAAAQTLLDAGHPVRVIVRNEKKGKSWKDKGAEVAIADLFDITAMTNALKGATAAYLLLPPDHANENYIQSQKDLADILLEAAQTANVKHVVTLSSVGVQLDEKSGPIITTAYLERIFEKSDIRSTAIRPGFFLENWLEVLPVIQAEGILPSFIQPLDFKIDMVATQDIGKKIADALLNPSDKPHRIIELKGTDQYSANNVAQAFSQALGKEVTAVEIPQEAWKETLLQAGFSNDLAILYIEMFENVNNERITYTETNVQNGQVSLGDFVKKQVA